MVNCKYFKVILQLKREWKGVKGKKGIKGWEWVGVDKIKKRCLGAPFLGYLGCFII